MPFLDLPVETALEPQLVADGEYTVRVQDAELKASKAGNNMVVLSYVFPTETNAQMMRDYLPLPTEADDAQTKNRKLLRMKQLMDCLGIGDVSDVKDLIGKEGIVVVSTEASTDPQYSDSNRVKKYIKA